MPTDTDLTLRPATSDDVPILARIWFEGWHDAHHDILPESLRQHRTEARFAERLSHALNDLRVLVRDGEVLGFTYLRHNEVYQLYLGREARGSGAAAALMDDAEAQLSARGFDHLILDCAIGNGRAERFYEKRGWINAGPLPVEIETDDGAIPLTVLRFEKRVQGR